jgi:predicted CXXCH cytochrome family protein
MINQRRAWIAAATALFIALVGAGAALAGEPPPQQSDNGACLACHSNPDLTYELPSPVPRRQVQAGEVWSLYVDEQVFTSSIHGQEGLACTACHTDIQGYPHPPLTVNSIRLYQLEQYQTCSQCHQEVYEKSLDSIHAREIAAGNWNAAICTDCHGAHDTTPPDQPRPKIPRTCSKCHAAIHNEYLESVHGEALVDEGNPDVPTCIDCHGVHNQEDPRTAQFRLNSPRLCATCHADPALMGKYDISTNVFDTYVADFHGTTVTLFERQSPDLPTNKPVCYDCHGVHNMKRSDDPQSQVFQENLLRTCQKCHPDATQSFSASWLSHYEPDIERYPVVYFVDLFYKLMIPSILGFMGVYVAVDLSSHLVRRLASKKHKEVE